MLYRGYWYENGLDNADVTAYPDPEDFGPAAADSEMGNQPYNFKTCQDMGNQRRSGYYTVQGENAYCDFTTRMGDVYQIPVFRKGSTNIDGISGFRDACAAKGFPMPARVPAT